MGQRSARADCQGRGTRLGTGSCREVSRRKKAADGDNLRKLEVMSTQALPTALAEIVDDFQALSEPERLQLLLEFSRGLPELPERLNDHPELLEQVVECQSPLFLTIETEKNDGGSPAFRLFFKAPPEAPTTRGFAGVLHEGLDGLTAEEILAVPDDMPELLGLTRAITPLRMRGMTAMLGRIKRKVAAAARLHA
jgi:cysteine desulfuration protein SufE